MIDRIDHIVLNWRNVEATASWFERVLGFRQETYSSSTAPRQRIALKFGQHKFNLGETGDASWWTCKVDAPGSLDLCFVTGGSLKPSSPGSRSPAFPSSLARPRGRMRSALMTSIYCEDPDGNLVEVSTHAREPVA